MRRGPVPGAVVAVFGIILGNCGAWACESQSFPRSVASDFLVEVTHDGKPVRGLRIALETVVEVESENQPARISSGVTNGEGKLAFAGLRSGNYSVVVVQPALPYSISVEVGGKGKNSKPAKRIDFEWPPGNVVSVRETNGTVRAAQETGNRILDLARPQFRPVPGASVVLADLISDNPLASTVTDTDGAFVLKTPPPGLYVLHIDRAADSSFRRLTSDTPIKIDPSVTDLVSDLYLREICGAMVVSNGYPH